MSELRNSFVALFGEDQAKAIEQAAERHHGFQKNRGDDPFAWAIIIAIGWEFFDKIEYRDYHGITAKKEDIKSWIKMNWKM